MNIIIFFIMIIMLLSASTCDIKTQIVPDIFPVLLGILGVVSVFLSGTTGITSHLLGAVVVSAPLLLASVLTNGFGGADIKLFAACGLILGARNIVLAFFIAIVLAAVFGVVYITVKKCKMKTKIPFVPFISIGVTVAAGFGEWLINWYLGLL